MAKDYSKIRGWAQSILECIGDEDEGENPKVPKQKQELDNGGQDKPFKFLPDDEGSEEKAGKKDSESDEDESVPDDEKKKKKDSSLAMLGSVLASRVGK
jgi:hypothetical protein